MRQKKRFLKSKEKRFLALRCNLLLAGAEVTGILPTPCAAAASTGKNGTPLRPTVERLAKAMLGQACPEDRVRYYN